MVEAEESPAGFDARRSARGKLYRYRIVNRGHPLAARAPLRLGVLPAARRRGDAPAAQRLVGRHDFSSFRASDCEAATAVREVRRFEVRVDGGRIQIEVEATAFLKHMVRNIVGTLVEVGAGKRARLDGRAPRCPRSHPGRSDRAAPGAVSGGGVLRPGRGPTRARARIQSEPEE